MSSKQSVSVTISGQEYRIKSDADEHSLQKVAQHVDQTMERIRKRTGTVDTLEVALLAALNLARELEQLRSSLVQSPPPSEGSLRALIELAESTAQSASASLS